MGMRPSSIRPVQPVIGGSTGAIPVFGTGFLLAAWQSCLSANEPTSPKGKRIAINDQVAELRRHGLDPLSRADPRSCAGRRCVRHREDYGAGTPFPVCALTGVRRRGCSMGKFSATQAATSARTAIICSKPSPNRSGAFQSASPTHAGTHYWPHLNGSDAPPGPVADLRFPWCPSAFGTAFGTTAESGASPPRSPGPSRSAMMRSSRTSGSPHGRSPATDREQAQSHQQQNCPDR